MCVTNFNLFFLLPGVIDNASCHFIDILYQQVLLVQVFDDRRDLSVIRPQFWSVVFDCIGKASVYFVEVNPVIDQISESREVANCVAIVAVDLLTTLFAQERFNTLTAPIFITFNQQTKVGPTTFLTLTDWCNHLFVEYQRWFKHSFRYIWTDTSWDWTVYGGP
jgi:hypothetical protein